MATVPGRGWFDSIDAPTVARSAVTDIPDNFAAASKITYAPGTTILPGGTVQGQDAYSNTVVNYAQPAQSSNGAPDLSTHDAQLAWVRWQLAGTKYANDDPNYWLGRINDTGGFTPDNLSYWGTNIKKEYWGSPEQIAAEAQNNGTVNPLNPGQFTYQPFTDQFTNPSFQAPTGLTEQNDPGYQARLALGAKALQNSAAAKGTLLTGQTLSDLNDYAQNFASNEFGNVYNRALTDYNVNSQNNWQQYQQKYQQYLNGFNQALTGFNTNLGAGQQAFGDTLALSAQNFGQNQQNWQNQFNLSQQQLNAAGMAANAGSNYANQAGGYLTGIGNANAAGSIAGGNAWGNAFANVANQVTPFFQSPYQNTTQPFQRSQPPNGSTFFGYGANY